MHARIALALSLAIILAQQSPISPDTPPAERTPPYLPVAPGLPPPGAQPNFTPPPPVPGQFSPPPVPTPSAINGNGIVGPGQPPGIPATAPYTCYPPH
jgi:hypothetical protein